MMNGVDPYGYMQRLAGRLDSLDDWQEIERALDDLEYLFEVMDPELQGYADDLIEQLRTKLKAFR